MSMKTGEEIRDDIEVGADYSTHDSALVSTSATLSALVSSHGEVRYYLPEIDAGAFIWLDGRYYRLSADDEIFDVFVGTGLKAAEAAIASGKVAQLYKKAMLDSFHGKAQL